MLPWMVPLILMWHPGDAVLILLGKSRQLGLQRLPGVFMRSWHACVCACLQMAL